MELFLVLLLGLFLPTLARVILLEDDLFSKDLDASYPNPEGPARLKNRIIFPTDEKWESEFLRNRNSFEIDPRFGISRIEATTRRSTGKESGGADEDDFLKWLQKHPNRNPLMTESATAGSGRNGGDYCLTCGTRLRCTPPDTLSPNGQCVPRVNI